MESRFCTPSRRLKGLLGRVLLFFPLAATAFSSARAEDKSPYMVAALGDSISAGFDASHFGDNREYSWSTGDDEGIESHYDRFRALFGDRVVAYNEATAGAHASALDRQIDRLLAEGKPDYVTILVGANDVCNWDSDYKSDLATYHDEVQGAIARLVGANPKVRVVMVPIPDVVRLKHLGQEHGCQFIWNIYPMCSILKGDSTAEDDADFSVRLKAANDSLAAVAARFPNNVRYESGLATYQFTWDDISQIDCFHPSVEGQKLMSSLTWKYGWYAAP